MKPRAVQQCAYGRNEVGPFDGTRRRDTYYPNDGRPPVEELRFVADPFDISGVHSTYPTGYDPRCSCCWLGFSHTEDCHAMHIRAHGRCSDRDCYKCRAEERREADHA